MNEVKNLLTNFDTYFKIVSENEIAIPCIMLKALGEQGMLLPQGKYDTVVTDECYVHIILADGELLWSVVME
jgi:hypothetical protein